MSSKKITHKLKTDFGINSSFGFIKDLNGMCRGHNHLLIAGTGKGKTTLIRSIAQDLSKEGKILYLSTEESVEDWEYYVEMSSDDYSNVEFLREEDLFNLLKLKDDSVGSFGLFTEALAIAIGNNGIKLLIVDNITTSLFYDTKKPSEQNLIFRILQQMIKAVGIPMLMIAHASAESQMSGTKLLTSQDIRNSKQISNKSEVLWCFHNEMLNINGDDVFFPFIYTEKNRTGSSSQLVYALEFDSEKRKYTSSRRISWATLRDNLENRARLSRRASNRSDKPKMKSTGNKFEIDFT